MMLSTKAKLVVMSCRTIQHRKVCRRWLNLAEKELRQRLFRVGKYAGECRAMQDIRDEIETIEGLHLINR